MVKAKCKFRREELLGPQASLRVTPCPPAPNHTRTASFSGLVEYDDSDTSQLYIHTYVFGLIWPVFMTLFSLWFLRDLAHVLLPNLVHDFGLIWPMFLAWFYDLPQSSDFEYRHTVKAKSCEYFIWNHIKPEVRRIHLGLPMWNVESCDKYFSVKAPTSLTIQESF